MKKNCLLLLLCAATCVSATAQNKIEDRIGQSTEVLRQILARPDAIPRPILNKAVCVLVFPGVKKVGVGLGVTYGRGLIVCRSGNDMNGPWSAPAMYKLNVGSLGAQLGSSSTDFIILVENKRSALKVLSGKLKLGADASAVAGPILERTQPAPTTRTSISLLIRERRADCLPALPWLALPWRPTMTPTRPSTERTSPQRK